MISGWGFAAPDPDRSAQDQRPRRRPITRQMLQAYGAVHRIGVGRRQHRSFGWLELAQAADMEAGPQLVTAVQDLVAMGYLSLRRDGRGRHYLRILR